MTVTSGFVPVQRKTADKMTAREVEDLLTASPSTARGAALFHLARRRQNLTAAQRQLVDEMVNVKPERVLVPQHPAESARLLQREDAELNAVELVWLQRLPHDPAQISHDDATQLAALAASVRATAAPASARLIRSIWEPVKELHDQRVAEAKLERVSQPAPFPVTAARALQDAISQEYDGLSTEAAGVQATQVADELRDRQARRHRLEVAAAQAELDEVRDSIKRRAETVREREL